MITKFYRNEKQTKYDLNITDKLGNDFTMLVGGNLDLYWVPENYKQVQTFYIDESDEFVYAAFLKLFNIIKQKDGNGYNYPKSFNGNVFTFISEDFPEDEANRLEIVKEKNQFVIRFIKNENLGIYGSFRRGCAICFCNSGSRVPEIEQEFMLMFNNLAYFNDEVKIIEN